MWQSASIADMGLVLAWAWSILCLTVIIVIDMHHEQRSSNQQLASSRMQFDANVSQCFDAPVLTMCYATVQLGMDHEQRSSEPQLASSKMWASVQCKVVYSGCGCLQQTDKLLWCMKLWLLAAHNRVSLWTDQLPCKSVGVWTAVDDRWSPMAEVTCNRFDWIIKVSCKAPQSSMLQLKLAFRHSHHNSMSAQYAG